jgi:type IV pilus assembly protein PilZ
LTIDDHNAEGRRAHRRVRLALQVSYRTAGAFLVSYTVDLSRGGLYLETPEPLPEGTHLELQVDVPGIPEDIRLRGIVVWRQTQPQGGHPAGMGVQFEGVEDTFGELIDHLVKHFLGLQALVVASTARSRAQLARHLKTSMTGAIVTEQAPEAPLPESFDPPLDLVVVDLEEQQSECLALVRRIRAGGYPTAVVALGASARIRQEARDAGADEVLASPAQLGELRAAMIRALARPVLLPTAPLGEE